MSACAGGGAGAPSSAPSAPATTSPTAKVTATIVIPARSRGSAGRRQPAYVSPSTQGLIVTVHDANGATTYGYDVAPNAPGCSTDSNGRTACSLTLYAAVGSDTFDAYLYDASEGTADPTTYTPSSAAAGKLLSEETRYAAPAIVASQANSVALTLSAVVDTVTAEPAVLSVSGEGGTTTAATYTPFDADANAIPLYGNASTTYANPIAFTITDSGNHSAVDGSSLAPTVTFDGAASVQPANATSTPYSATLAGSTSISNAGYGNTTSYPTSTANVTIAPLFLFAPTTGLPSGASVTLFALAAAVPPGATYAIAKTPDGAANSCDNFSVTTSNAAPAPPRVAVYTVTADSASPTSGGAPIPCVFAVSDGTGTTTTSAPFTASANGATPTPSATPSPSPSPSPTPVPTTAGSVIIVVPTPAPSVTSTS